MDEELKFENKSSYIYSDKKNLRIVRKKGESAMPVGVVNILQNLSIEIGRDINEFISCLKEIRMPVFIQKVAQVGKRCSWKIIRINVGKLERVDLGIIEAYDDTIISFIYSKDITGVYNEYTTNIKRYVKLPVCYLYITKKAECVHLELLRFIRDLTGIKNIKVIKKNKRVIDVVVRNRIYNNPIVYRFGLYGDTYKIVSIFLGNSVNGVKYYNTKE